MCGVRLGEDGGVERRTEGDLGEDGRVVGVVCGRLAAAVWTVSERGCSITDG